MGDLINRKDVLDILGQCARDILFDYGLHGLLYESMEEIEKLQSVELCEDCVSRKSAVEAVRDHDWMQAVFTIAHLPSAEPERKTGKWEYIQYDGNPKIGNWHCSNCRLIVNLGFEGAPYYDYCPGCGARMGVDNG